MIQRHGQKAMFTVSIRVEPSLDVVWLVIEIMIYQRTTKEQHLLLKYKPLIRKDSWLILMLHLLLVIKVRGFV